MKTLFAGTLAVLLVATLAGCPLGRGSKKVGEKCADNNECAQAHCQASESRALSPSS